MVLPWPQPWRPHVLPPTARELWLHTGLLAPEVGPGQTRAARCLPPCACRTVLAPAPGGGRTSRLDSPCPWSLRHADGIRETPALIGSGEDMAVSLRTWILPVSLNSTDSRTFPKSSLERLGSRGLWKTTALRQARGALCKSPVVCVSSCLV